MNSLIFTGDMFLGDGLPVSGSDIYTDLLPILSACDLNVTNLESVLLNTGDPIFKLGPALKSNPDLVKVLTTGKFGVATLANNHIMDYGTKGLLSTLDICRDSHIGTVGAGMNLTEARKPLFRTVGNVKVGIINFCENEFSTTSGNRPGANPLDPVGNFYDIQEAKKNCDILFVVIHGGSEYYSLPTPRMQKTYRFFADAGADAVIGHHTHAYSGYEVYNGKPIFYSLGNFIFNVPPKPSLRAWHEGFMVQFSISKKSISFLTHPYVQFLDGPSIRLMTEEEKRIFDGNIHKLNAVISDPALLAEEYNKFLKTQEKSYLNRIEPYTGLLLSLRYRRILPSLISAKKKAGILNTVRCEAHRDILINSLTNSIADEDCNT